MGFNNSQLFPQILNVLIKKVVIYETLIFEQLRGIEAVHRDAVLIDKTTSILL